MLIKKYCQITGETVISQYFSIWNENVKIAHHYDRDGLDCNDIKNSMKIEKLMGPDIPTFSRPTETALRLY